MDQLIAVALVLMLEIVDEDFCQCTCEELYHELLIMGICGNAFFLLEILDDGKNHPVEIGAEKALHLIPSHGVIGAVENMAVGIYIVGNKHKGFLSVAHKVEVFHNLHRLLLQCPFQKIVDVGKVIVKGLAVKATIGDDLRDTDFRQGLMCHELFQGGGEGFLRVQTGNGVLHCDHLGIYYTAVLQILRGVFADI